MPLFRVQNRHPEIIHQITMFTFNSKDYHQTNQYGRIRIFRNLKTARHQLHNANVKRPHRKTTSEFR